jgi:hypothetical protein
MTMNDEPIASGPLDPRRRRRRAVLRLVLGQLQIIGATIGFYFLITTGASALTIWAVGLTDAVSALSRYLFKVVWRDQR